MKVKEASKRLAQFEKQAGGAERVVIVMESISEFGKFAIDPTGERDGPLYAEAEVAKHLPAGDLKVVWVRFGSESAIPALGFE